MQVTLITTEGDIKKVNIKIDTLNYSIFCDNTFKNLLIFLEKY